MLLALAGALTWAACDPGGFDVAVDEEAALLVEPLATAAPEDRDLAWSHENAPQILDSVQTNRLVKPGEVVTLQVSAIDPNALPLTYAWSATQGNLSARAAQAGNGAIWTAPFIDDTVVVTVQVENTWGLQAAASFQMQVLADLDTAVFVRPGGSKWNTGSPAEPYATVQHAIEAAAADGKTNVVLAAGTYPEALQVPANIHLWGQYDPDTWSHVATSATVVSSPSPVGIIVSDPAPSALDGAAGPRPETVENGEPSGSIQGLIVETEDGGPQQSAIAVLLNNVSGRFLVQDNILQPGAGGRGIAGGAVGGNACPGAIGAGGNHTQAGFPGGSGCRGANNGSPGGPGGAPGGSFGGHGGIGGRGYDGAQGTIPAGQNIGLMAGTNWQALGGTAGKDGGGGGGGGGGGSGLVCIGWWMCAPTLGGNGGVGGHGGRAGSGGSGAGGSFGIIVLDSPGSVLVQSNLIETSDGGIGGRGGDGTGGIAGAAGVAGWFSGNGGNGGAGGHGGGGSGGGGGMSVGILRRAAPDVVETGNVYYLGFGGAGGTGGWPGAPTGTAGISADTFILP